MPAKRLKENYLIRSILNNFVQLLLKIAIPSYIYGYTFTYILTFLSDPVLPRVPLVPSHVTSQNAIGYNPLGFAVVYNQHCLVEPGGWTS